MTVSSRIRLAKLERQLGRSDLPMNLIEVAALLGDELLSLSQGPDKFEADAASEVLRAVAAGDSRFRDLSTPALRLLRKLLEARCGVPR